MEIKEYENNPYHLAQLVDLINYCQNIEAKLDIKMAEQDDIFQIENYYQNRKGQFWIALENEKVVVSYRDLKELGLNDKIAHGLIKQVYDGYSAEKIPLVDSIKKLKFIYKKDLVSCLNDIMKNLEEKKYV